MRRLTRATALALALALAAAAAAPPPAPSPEEARKRAERAREAVRRLGDPEYGEREAATKNLEELGEAALPDLRDATTSADPEVRRRAEWLVVVVLRAAGKSAATDMVLAPVLPGTFEMGSQKSERARQADEAPHTVRITRWFLIGTHEVTQADYQKVMKTNPSWFCATGGGKDKDKIKGADTSRFPVEQVSWFDALDFCNGLSERDGYAPFYKLADVKRDGSGSITAAAVSVPGGSGYRLPTEAEWEYACRSWTLTPFHYGRASTQRDLNAKIFIGGGGGYGTAPETAQLGRTAAVGGYRANRRGLHDVHGNVAEWCWDWYGRDYYDASPAADPRGPDAGTHRVVRGGSWLVNDTSCRSAARAMMPPGERGYGVGFRVARTP